MSPRYLTKIQHPTHSAWSERKGQWPRVLCATSPRESRLRDHGSPVHCKFEGQRRTSTAFITKHYRLPCGVQLTKTAYQPIKLEEFESAFQYSTLKQLRFELYLLSRKFKGSEYNQLFVSRRLKLISSTHLNFLFSPKYFNMLLDPFSLRFIKIDLYSRIEVEFSQSIISVIFILTNQLCFQSCNASFQPSITFSVYLSGNCLIGLMDPATHLKIK